MIGIIGRSFDVTPEQVRGASLVEVFEGVAYADKRLEAFALRDLCREVALDRRKLFLEFFQLALGILQLFLEPQLFERRNRVFQRLLFFK